MSQGKAKASTTELEEINKKKPLYFWGHSSNSPTGYLSQWFPCKFLAPALSFPEDAAATTDGDDVAAASQLTFHSCEHYMMYHKALLFNDTEAADKILVSVNPKTAKALGRSVQGFDEAVWERNRQRIVTEGNWHKFTQVEGDDPEKLGRRLLETGNRLLVEASPRDRIWGIGFSADKAEANREYWGLNLLGEALVEVRQRLKQRETGAA